MIGLLIFKEVVINCDHTFEGSNNGPFLQVSLSPPPPVPRTLGSSRAVSEGACGGLPTVDYWLAHWLAHCGCAAGSHGV